MSSNNVMLTNADGNPEIFEGAKSVVVPTEDGTLKEFVDPANGEHIRVKVTENGVVVVEAEEGQIINSVTVETEVEGEAVTVQANWMQTDPEKPDYIKNKPTIPDPPVQPDWAEMDARNMSFIHNKPFGPIPDVVVEQEMKFKLSVMDSYSAGGDFMAGDLVAGERYIVNWDGSSFTCRAYHIAEFLPALANNDIVCLGNQTLFWNGGYGINTGEPFFVCIGNDYLNIETLSEEPTHLVGIRPVNNFKKIDKSWLPDDIGGGGSINIQVSEVEVDVLEEQEITFQQMDMGTTAVAELPSVINLVKGETYFVSIDDIVYECVAQEITENGVTGWYIGTPPNQSGDEPFVIITGPMGSENILTTMIMVNCKPDEPSIALTVRVYKKVSGELKTVEYHFGERGIPKVNFVNELFGMTFYKISDELPTKEQLNGASFYSNYDEGVNEEITNVLTPDMLMLEGADFIGYGTFRGNNGGYAIGVAYKAGTLSAEVMGTSVEVEVPEPGIYVPYDGTKFDNWYVKLEYFVESSFKLQADWNESNPNSVGYIANRPFYEDINPVQMIPVTEVPFFFSTDNNAYMFGTQPTQDMMDAWSSTWDEAEVIWDGVTYNCKVGTAMGMKFVGNIDAAMGLGDNGIPFVASIVLGSLSGGSDMAMVMSTADPPPADPDNASAIYHTIGIKLFVKDLKKIDAKFLTKADWNEADQNSAAAIKNKPFGTALEGGRVVTDVTLPYDESDMWFLFSPGSIDWEAVVPGATYRGTLNGQEFVGKAVSTAEAVSMIGIPVFGIAFTDNDGALQWGLVDYLGMYQCVIIRNSSFVESLGLVSGQFYPIKIVSEKYNKIISDDFLPFGHSVKSTGYAIADMPCIKSGGTPGFCLYRADFEGKTLVPGKTYLVTFGTKQYQLDAWSMDEAAGIGSLELLVALETGSPIPELDVPFGMMENVTYDGEYHVSGYNIFSLEDMGAEFKLSIENTVDDIRAIPHELLPDAPVFDMVEMGLAAIPLTGSYVYVSGDMTAIRTAAARGTMKAIVQINLGMSALEVHTIGGLSYIPSSDVYSSTTMAIFEGTPYAVEIIISKNRIDARAIKLATPAT